MQPLVITGDSSHPGLPNPGPRVTVVIMSGFSAAWNFKMVTWNTYMGSKLLPTKPTGA